MGLPGSPKCRGSPPQAPRCCRPTRTSRQQRPNDGRAAPDQQQHAHDCSPHRSLLKGRAPRTCGDERRGSHHGFARPSIERHPQAARWVSSARTDSAWRARAMSSLRAASFVASELAPTAVGLVNASSRDRRGAAGRLTTRRSFQVVSARLLAVLEAALPIPISDRRGISGSRLLLRGVVVAHRRTIMHLNPVTYESTRPYRIGD